MKIALPPDFSALTRHPCHPRLWLMSGAVLMVVVASLAMPSLTLVSATAPAAPATLWSMWTWNPIILFGIFGLWIAYLAGVRKLWRRAGSGRGVARWRVGAFLAGLLALFAALLSPLDALAEALQSAHMAQHLLLIVVAAPLLVLGAPEVALFWAAPLRLRKAVARTWNESPLLQSAGRSLTAPVAALAISAALIWLWHAPGLYQAALDDSRIHAAEHFSFLVGALLYWRCVLPTHARPQARLGISVLLAFVGGMSTGLLGALMYFARTPWYPAYAARSASWGIALLTDQQLAGLLMWIPMNAVYMGVALWLFALWLTSLETRARRREALLDETMANAGEPR